MFIPNDQLSKILLENNLVSEENIKTAQKKVSKENITLYDAVLKLGLINDENLGRLIADQLKLPFISLKKVDIPQDILKIIPEVVARKQKIIAFARDTNGLKLAVFDPANKEIIEFIEKKTGDKITIYLTTQSQIEDALSYYKQDIQKSFDDLLKEQVNAAEKLDIKQAPISKIVDLLINYAYQNKSSDIHIEPKDKSSLIRFRIDGILHDVLNIPISFHEQLISRIKVLSRLRTDEHLSAQDGKMQAKLPLENIDIRVSIVPIVDGEKAVLRLLSSHSRQFSLTELGMSENDLAKVKEGFNKSYGMLLSTGPTGSGKTTTIYEILKILNTREKNIATIEDPVEYDIEGINQIQVNPKTNLTFADGLRSILRQDPDIIFVGEIRDEETADIAINSAMTGHLVLSTIHTNNAATTLPRLIDMNIAPFLISSTVNVIIGQRLVRKICDKCKVSQIVTRAELSKNIAEEKLIKYFGKKNELRFYKGKGCTICHTTGYIGRIGIFEVLQITDTIRKLISLKANSDEIERQAIKEGMKTMFDDGLDKTISGLTTIEEVVRATRE